jgi:hypothetical protein
MAEFCTDCADRYGFIAEIETEKILARLKPGNSHNVLCEGCELVALFKDDDSAFFKGYNNSGQIRWVKVLEDLL